MAKPGITVISSFTYRGVAEEYSNQFHFTGSAPTDAAGWNDLCAEFVTLFKAMLPAAVVTIERIYCYSDTDNDSVYTYNLADHGGTVNGSASAAVYTYRAPGDGAYWVRWATGRINSKGKAVYLRKYLHPAFGSSGNADLLDTTLRGNVATAAAALASAGTHWPGLAGPSYDLPASPAVVVSQYITTRTLKRRGRRP